MNAEDFEELKAICEEKGFDITIESMNEAMISVKKKDPWAGVEFVIPNHNSPCLKKPYKAVSFKNGFVQVYCPYSGDGSLSQLQLNEVDPSTEQAYVEQLKKRARDKFGEIKIGDKFYTDFDNESFRIDDDYGFEYRKLDDTLFYSGWSIYQQGKWAERANERIEVKFIHSEGEYNSSNEFEYRFHFVLKNGYKNCHSRGDLLASMLETYLNGEE